MIALPLAVEIADAVRKPGWHKELDAIANRLHKGHPEAAVQYADIVMVLEHVRSEALAKHAALRPVGSSHGCA